MSAQLSVSDLRTKSLQHFVCEDDCKSILERQLDAKHNVPCLTTRAVVRRTNFLIDIESEFSVSIDLEEFSDTEVFVVKGKHDWLLSCKNT